MELAHIWDSSKEVASDVVSGIRWYDKWPQNGKIMEELMMTFACLVVKKLFP